MLVCKNSFRTFSYVGPIHNAWNDFLFSRWSRIDHTKTPTQSRSEKPINISIMKISISWFMLLTAYYVIDNQTCHPLTVPNLQSLLFFLFSLTYWKLNNSLLPSLQRYIFVWTGLYIPLSLYYWALLFVLFFVFCKNIIWPLRDLYGLLTYLFSKIKYWHILNYKPAPQDNIF